MTDKESDTQRRLPRAVPKTAELARLITHGLRDVWSAAKKLDAAMKMS